MGPGREAHDFSRGRQSPVRAARPEGVTPRRDDLTVGYRSTNKTVYSAKYHIIWCPKQRRRLLTGRVETRLKQIIARVVDEAGGQVIEVEARALWSASWFVSTVGGAPLEVVRRYVENQKMAT